jgi:hypothetical protein
VKRFAAHRLHRLDALELKPPPAVKGFSSDTMPAAQIFDTHTACELAQDFLSDYVCNFHGLKTKPGRVNACPGFFL